MTTLSCMVLLLVWLRVTFVQVLHPDFGMASQACWPAAASAMEPTEDIILHKLRLCTEAGLLQVCMHLLT